MKLDEELNKILSIYLSEKLQESTPVIDGDMINDYINEMQEYIKNEQSFKNKKIEIIKKYI